MVSVTSTVYTKKFIELRFPFQIGFQYVKINILTSVFVLTFSCRYIVHGEKRQVCISTRNGSPVINTRSHKE